MDEKDNWKQVAVTFQQFGYEHAGAGRNTELWNNPFAFRRYGGQLGRILDEDFEEWLQAHRVFTRDEVLKGSWVKISDLNNHTVREVHFLPDGTLTENELFSPQEKWQGSWQIISGVLIMRIGEYVLSIYAAKEGLMHSGV